MGSERGAVELKYGPWTDYSSDFWQKHQWQISEWEAQLSSILIPILWATAVRGWSVMIGHISLENLRPADNSTRKEKVAKVDWQRQGARGARCVDRPPRTTVGAMGGVNARATANDDSAEAEESQSAPGSRSKPSSSWDYGHFAIQGVLLLTWAIVGIYAARITQYETGLAGGTKCGHYELLDGAGIARKIEDDHKVQEPKEARAAHYHQSCYKQSGLSNPDLCGIFYNQSIAYTTQLPSDRACPFTAPDICAEPYGAFHFTTDLFDTSVLGINIPHAPKARRSATCVPLNVSEPFVTTSISEADGRRQSFYWYGPTERTNWTFNTSGDPFESSYPVYAVTIHTSYPGSIPGFWTPSDELRRLSGTSLSIFFIITGHIRYFDASTG